MEIAVVVGATSIPLTTPVTRLLCGPAYFLFGEAGRISDLEDGFQGMQPEVARRLLQPARISDNSDPPDQDRGNRLLRGLEANKITKDEAIELNEILIAEGRAAREE